jgi:hypothetical protein
VPALWPKRGVLEQCKFDFHSSMAHTSPFFERSFAQHYQCDSDFCVTAHSSVETASNVPESPSSFSDIEFNLLEARCAPSFTPEAGAVSEPAFTKLILAVFLFQHD